MLEFSWEVRDRLLGKGFGLLFYFVSVDDGSVFEGFALEVVETVTG